MLFAEGGGSALAVASLRAADRAVGQGLSARRMAWQDLSQHFEMRWRYAAARDGNVGAHRRDRPHPAREGDASIALGFGRAGMEEAALKVRASLSQGVGRRPCQEICRSAWRAWQGTLLLPLPTVSNPGKNDIYRISTAVMRTHEEGSFAGGYIASLSIPWGFKQGRQRSRRLSTWCGRGTWWRPRAGCWPPAPRPKPARLSTTSRASRSSDGHWPQELLAGRYRLLVEGVQMGRNRAAGPADRLGMWREVGPSTGISMLPCGPWCGWPRAPIS